MLQEPLYTPDSVRKAIAYYRKYIDWLENVMLPLSECTPAGQRAVIDTMYALLEKKGKARP